MSNRLKLIRDMQTGTLVATRIDSPSVCVYTFEFTTPSKNWHILHPSNTNRVKVQIKSGGSVISAKNIKIIDSSNILVEFSAETSGILILTAFSNNEECIAPTPTQSPSASATPTPTLTRTVSPTITPTQTRTPSISPSISLTASPTPSVSLTSSMTPTVTRTQTPTPTASATPTFTPTATQTRTVTPTVTATMTLTPSVTATMTPTAQSTPTPSVTSSQNAVSLDFDYAIVRFDWAQPNGIDLDIRVDITNPTRNVVVGADRNPIDGPYLTWGGDNQTQFGQEAVLIDFLTLKTDYPSIDEFVIRLRAFWYTQKIDGNVRIDYQSYKGGVMQQTADNDFINVGGSIVDTKSIFVNVPSQGGLELDGDEIAFLLFDTITNVGELVPQIIAVSPTPTPTLTATRTVTATRTPTPTNPATPTMTPTISVTRTVTATVTPDVSPTMSPTISLTPSVTRTSTATATPTLTPGFSVSVTPTVTFTPTPTRTQTLTPEITKSATPTPTVTFTPTPSPTPAIEYIQYVNCLQSLGTPITVTSASTSINAYIPSGASGDFILNITQKNFIRTGSMWGSPFAANRSITDDSDLIAIMQHAFENEQQFEDFKANGGYIMIGLTAISDNTVTYQSVTRNGYTSNSYTAFAGYNISYIRFFDYTNRVARELYAPTLTYTNFDCDVPVSFTPTPTVTRTVTPTYTPTPTATRTITPTPSVTRTFTPTPSITSSVTPSVGLTPTPEPPIEIVDQDFDKVTTLIHFDGPNGSTTFTDSAGRIWLAQNGADIRTDVSKFGGASGWFLNTANDGGGELGSRITSPDSPNLTFGTGDFTIEGWFLPQAPLLGFGGFFRKGQNTADGLQLAVTPTQLIMRVNTFTDITIPVTISTTEWSHIAFCRKAGVVRFFVNGNLVGTEIISFNHTSNESAVIGTATGDTRFAYRGRIDELRITKGLSRYVESFTPPGGPFPDIGPARADELYDNVVSLLHFDGAEGSTSFVDEKGPAWNIPVSGPIITTQQAEFGGASGRFTTGYISRNGGSDFAFGTGDFTIEFFCRRVSGNGIIFDDRTGAAGPGMAIYSPSGTTDIRFFANAADRLIAPSGTLDLQEGVHVAVCRASGITRMFINGISVGGTYADTNNYQANTWVIGAAFNGTNQFNGFVEEFRATAGAARYVTNFTPPTSRFPDAAESPKVASLLHFDGANNTTLFTDASGKNWTRAGNAILRNLQSKFGGTSMLLDGAGDYISHASNYDFAFGKGDFTVEWFQYWNNTKLISPIDFRAGVASSPRLMVYNETSTSTDLRLYVNGADRITAPSGTLVIDTWQHIAISRNNGITRMFVDGTQVGSDYLDSTIYTAADWNIGRNTATANRDFNGYIDEFRAIKGQGLYTTGFTPPIAPFENPILTPVVSTLLHFNNANGVAVFDDNTNKQWSRTANAQISTVQSKFGGSSLQIQTGDTIETWANPDFEFGSGDFTIEGWYYWNDIAAPNRDIITFGPNWDIYTGGGTIFAWNGTVNLINGGVVITTNTWYHIALTRQSGQLRLFVNGTQVGATAIAPTYLAAAPVYFGFYPPNLRRFNGYVDEARITKGLARYTTNFVPPTEEFSEELPAPATDTFFSNVVSLLHFDGTNGSTEIVDRNIRTWTVSGDAALSTVQSKFGPTSLALNGTNSVVISPNDTNFDFGTSNFTVECWVYLNSNNTLGYIFSRGNGAGTNGGFAMAVNADGKLMLVHQGVAFQTVGSTTLRTGEWYHLAISRAGSAVRLFVNGNLDATAINTTNYTAASATNNSIGSNLDAGIPVQFLHGFIDELRITKGAARYTAPFIPPTGPFPDIGATDPSYDNVSALLNFDGENNSTTFNDTKGSAWTANGNAKITTISPKFGSGAGTFDGSGDFIVSDTRTSLGFATGNFTIEGWFKRGAIGTNQGLYTRGLLTGGFDQQSLSHAVFFGGDNILNFRIYNGTNGILNIPSISPVTDTTEWHHFAFVGSGSTLYGFLDGVLQGTVNTYVQQNDAATWRSVIGSFGASWGLHFNGQVDEVRVTKGIARYTSNFLPPAAPYPAAGPATPYAALLHLDGVEESTVFTDIAGNPWTTTGIAKISNLESKFGGGSLRLTNIGTNFIESNGSDFNFGTGDFCIEGFYRPDADTNRAFFHLTGTLQLLVYTASGGWSVFFDGGNVIGPVGVATAGVWHHIAFNRYLGVMNLFVDGVRVANYSNGTALNPPSIRLGYFNAGNPAGGYYDEFRVVKGDSVYQNVASFTPPAAPFS